MQDPLALPRNSLRLDLSLQLLHSIPVEIVLFDELLVLVESFVQITLLNGAGDSLIDLCRAASDILAVRSSPVVNLKIDRSALVVAPQGLVTKLCGIREFTTRADALSKVLSARVLSQITDISYHCLLNLVLDFGNFLLFLHSFLLFKLLASY